MGGSQVQRKRDTSEIAEVHIIPEIRDLIPSMWKRVMVIQFVVVFLKSMYMGIVAGAVGEPEDPRLQSDKARCIRIVRMLRAIG